MKSEGRCETLRLGRAEMQRIRMKRKTDRGTSVGIILDPQCKLGHGDVLLDGKEKFIIVEQLPEKVLSVILRNHNTSRIAEMAALVGHTVGNRHRPIAVTGKTISFPLLADSEIELFKKLFTPHPITLRIEERIFLPSVSMVDIHEH
jgi:urease accessory protein UreE